MSHPEKTKSNKQTATAKAKKQESKKSITERLAGKAPFDWLKVDATIGMGK